MTDFDPFAYAADVKAHPENYISLAEIARDAANLVKIKRATTVQGIKDALREPARAAKAAGDTWLLQRLTEAATARKQAISSILP